jgi:hypothetical protein
MARISSSAAALPGETISEGVKLSDAILCRCEISLGQLKNVRAGRFTRTAELKISPISSNENPGPCPFLMDASSSSVAAEYRR